MKTGLTTALILALVLTCVACFSQTVVLREAPGLVFLSSTDSNSPAFWDGDKFYILNSNGGPKRSEGKDQFSLGNNTQGVYDNADKIKDGRWMECAWRTDDGVLYGWYHRETGGVCPDRGLPIGLVVPSIGAARSTDNGLHWTDLGLILQSRPDSMHCDAQNGFFAGGNGDCSCMLSKDGKYIYFFFGAYAGAVTEQGIGTARMLWKDRDKPVGKVYKYNRGEWNEPGLGGRLSPVFPASVDWKRSTPDSFWGPAPHWNTYLGKYVMLLNRTRRKWWSQEGVYITYSDDISDPGNWSTPRKILNGGRMYPQVLGVDAKAKETDKLAGHQARFYMGGLSDMEIVFFKESEDTTNLPPVYAPGK